MLYYIYVFFPILQVLDNLPTIKTAFQYDPQQQLSKQKVKQTMFRHPLKNAVNTTSHQQLHDIFDYIIFYLTTTTKNNPEKPEIHG